MVIEDTEERWSRARVRSREQGERRILGIAGRPGAGSRRSRARSWRSSASRARLVPMDGFHLAQAELVRLGRRDRMGAPDTFDASGYAALLTRLRGDEPIVYAPEFRREIEEPIAGAIAVPREIPLVVTEGNYLLAVAGTIKPLLDECWYVETDEELRVQRLIQRHIQFGKTPEYARAWVMRSDERNAALSRRRPPRRRARVAYSFSSCSVLPPSTMIDWPVT